MNRGRPGTMPVLKNLLALVGALSEPYGVLEADDVSRTLGVSRERAWELLCLLASAADDPERDLALIPLDVDPTERYLALTSPSASSMRPLRLSAEEATAVTSLLDALLGERDPEGLRTLLERGYFPLDHHGIEGRRPACDEDAWDLLVQVIHALLARERISFSYQGESDPSPRRRTVEVLDVTERDGHWLLWTQDVERGERRIFRLDRMDELRPTGVPAELGPEPMDPKPGGRPVRLRFHDPRYLDGFLQWTGVTQRRNLPSGEVTVLVGDLGGDWLPRRLIACGGAVTCDDESVRERVRDLLGRMDP